MKRTLFLILLSISISLETISKVNNFVNPLTFYLYKSINKDEDQSKDDLHRSIRSATIQDNVITFDSFEEDCIIQIIDVENETIIFEDFISSGDTMCSILEITTGSYMIKFVGYDFVYSGYFQI